SLYLAAGGDSAKPADKTQKKAAAPASQAGQPAGPDPKSKVAVVGGQSISFEDLALKVLNQQEFDARRQVLDTMINEMILSKEAAAVGVEKDALIEKEVTSKVGEPSQSEIDAWYEQNKSRVGNQTKEQIAPQISAMLRSQKMGAAQQSYMADLRQKYGVKILMEPPRIAVSLDDDASKGPLKAPVTIVEFSDYQCPYCSKAESTVVDVLKKYGDKIHFVYRDYPLSFHQNSEVAAEAAECAKDQGKFWEMHNAMFANQDKLASADLVTTAAGLGLDKDKFKACLDSGQKKQEVQKDFQDGQKYGVTGTPTFFINGIKLVGAREIGSFTELIDQELQKKN
ncbi:MAG TPA: thioredoxin domain-containing protein, partial [Candidatus Polarisedimenticolia bacterium]|nr:thioredoxin domain-containing protein [Candidatus Polarisedimenticolia bacterium]